MELKAVIMGLRALNEPRDVSVFTDSTYVHDGMTGCLALWGERGWRNSRGRPLPNRRLWIDLRNAATQHRISCFWVKAHAGNDQQNRCETCSPATRPGVLREQQLSEFSSSRI